MKKKPVPKRTAAVKSKPGDLAPLIAEVRQLVRSARRGVAPVIDTFQVTTNFEIGRRVVEHEQKGEKQAGYGKGLLKELSARLTQEFGRGFSKANLEYMRRFYLEWRSRVPTIPQTASGQLLTSEICQQPAGKLEIAQTASGQSSPAAFTLSWSHYVLLIGIKDPDERSFYEIESRQSDWNVRELKRQKASALYHRLALSRDKAGVKRLAAEGQIVTRPEDVLKEPTSSSSSASTKRPATLSPTSNPPLSTTCSICPYPPRLSTMRTKGGYFFQASPSLP